MLDSLFDVFEKAPGAWLIIICIASIILGMYALIKGADFFVGGAASIARKLGVSTLIIGLTIVSFGTSLPEASVSISSSIKGSNGLSIGNVIGSNIFNVLMVVGISALFAPIIVKKDILKRDLPFLLGSGILMILFTVLFNITGDYDILRFECIILLVLFFIYMVVSIITTKREEEKKEETENRKSDYNKVWLCIIALIIGLVGIVIGGEFVTWGASELAIKMGADELLVGLTIVALGTSLPELVTSVVAIKKKEDDIALGNVIGSCIFNMLFILGIAGTISPFMNIGSDIIFDVIFMFLIFVLFSLFCFFSKKGIGKKAGIVFVLLYIAYVVFIIIRNYAL